MAPVGAPPTHLSVHYYKKAIPLSLVRKILRREQAKIYQRFAEAFPPSPSARILDLGVNGALHTRELYFFESLYPFPERIVAAGLEEGTLFSTFYPSSSYVRVRREGGLPFLNKEFDLTFCSAVIEHVGERSAQRQFLSEIIRVSRSVFLTTPNRWYPVELHTMLPFFHYLPPAIYRRAYKMFGFEFFSREENLNLLDSDSLLRLVSDTVSFRLERHWFLGLPSNLLLIIDR